MIVANTYLIWSFKILTVVSPSLLYLTRSTRTPLEVVCIIKKNTVNGHYQAKYIGYVEIYHFGG